MLSSNDSMKVLYWSSAFFNISMSSSYLTCSWYVLIEPLIAASCSFSEVRFVLAVSINKFTSLIFFSIVMISCFVCSKNFNFSSRRFIFSLKSLICFSFSSTRILIVSSIKDSSEIFNNSNNWLITSFNWAVREFMSIVLLSFLVLAFSKSTASRSNSSLEITSSDITAICGCSIDPHTGHGWPSFSSFTKIPAMLL